MELRERRKEIKFLSDETNKLKEMIELKKEYLKKKQDGKNQEEIQQGIIDEEEFAIIKEIKDYKKDYKTKVEKVKGLKSTISIVEQNIQQVNFLCLFIFLNECLNSAKICFLQSLKNGSERNMESRLVISKTL